MFKTIDYYKLPPNLWRSLSIQWFPFEQISLALRYSFNLCPYSFMHGVLFVVYYYFLRMMFFIVSLFQMSRDIKNEVTDFVLQIEHIWKRESKSGIVCWKWETGGFKDCTRRRHSKRNKIYVIKNTIFWLKRQD